MNGGMGGRQGGGNGGAAPTGATTPNVSRGEVMLASDQGNQGDQQGRGGRGQMPEVTDKDCDAVKAAFAKHPDAEQKLVGLRGRVQSGELDFQADAHRVAEDL